MPAQWADNGCMNDRPRALHLKACRFGVTVLKVFWWTTLVAVIALAAALAAVIAGPWPIGPWLGCTAVVAVVETIVFWTGIVTVYLSSVQLGLNGGSSASSAGGYPSPTSSRSGGSSASSSVKSSSKRPRNS